MPADPGHRVGLVGPLDQDPVPRGPGGLLLEGLHREPPGRLEAATLALTMIRQVTSQAASRATGEGDVPPADDAEGRDPEDDEVDQQHQGQRRCAGAWWRVWPRHAERGAGPA